MNNRASVKLILVVWFGLALTACGGGGETEYSGSTTGSGGDTSSNNAVGTATVSWVAPLGRMDGGPISIGEIGGYIVYYGTSSGNIVNTVVVPGGSSTEQRITGLTPATYYFQVSAYDQQGVEGPRSGVASKVVQ
jgi:hypothetical protein